MLLNPNAAEFIPEPSPEMFPPILSDTTTPKYEFNGNTYFMGTVAPYMFRPDFYNDDNQNLCLKWVLVGEADLVDDDGTLSIYNVYFYDNTEEYKIKMAEIEEEDEKYERELAKIEGDEDYFD
jgi:hypothetical protein